MYQPFDATIQLAQGESTVPVVELNNQMVICAHDYPIYITKEQAMKFFNLEPKKE